MYNNEDYLSTQDKEKMIYEYERNAERRLQIGKIIVYAIAISSFVLTLLSNVLYGFNLFNIIVRLAMSVALVKGVRWVRWLFVATAFISVLTFITFLAASHTEALSVFVWGILIFGAILDLTDGILLAFNKCVAEFLYSQYARK